MAATVEDVIPPVRRRAIAEFPATPPPRDDGPSVFSHNDLGIEHVLFDLDTHRGFGVIDWTDAALTRAARAFGLIYRDLGPKALDAALDTYRIRLPGPPHLAGLARFYARCSVIADLAYGRQPGRAEYPDKCLTSLTWLFPAS